LLAPRSLREQVSRFTAFIVFKIPRRFIPVFERALRLAGGAEPVEFVSPRGEEDTAIVVHRLTPKGTVFRALVEYRGRRKAPYKKVSPRRLGRVLKLIDEIAKGKRLERWTQVVGLPRDAFVQSAPTVAKMLGIPATFALSGRAVSITGVKLRVSPAQGSQGPGASIGLNLDDKVVTLTITVGGGPIAAFNEVFLRGPQLAFELVTPADQQEAEEGRGGKSDGGA